MRIKSISSFILSLAGVTQLSIPGGRDYDPHSIAQVKLCENDFKVANLFKDFFVLVHIGPTNRYCISVSEPVKELLTYEVMACTFSADDHKPWKPVEDLSNDAQAWLRPGGA